MLDPSSSNGLGDEAGPRQRPYDGPFPSARRPEALGLVCSVRRRIGHRCTLNDLEAPRTALLIANPRRVGWIREDEDPHPRRVRAGARPAAVRAGATAGVDHAGGPEGRCPVRGSRHGGQRRRDQADHRTHQPARGAHGCARHAERPRADAVVLPALRGPPAGGRRNGPVRPQLVQPRRGRAGDGLLHRRGVRASSCAPVPASSTSSSARESRS